MLLTLCKWAKEKLLSSMKSQIELKFSAQRFAKFPEQFSVDCDNVTVVGGTAQL